MIRGLEIMIGGEELTRRIGERIRCHEAAVSALDARIKQREGDLPFDIRAEDGFKTLGELEVERQRWRDRVTHLTLLRDNIAVTQRYVLGKSDLRLADLISSDVADDSQATSNEGDVLSKRAPIDGLKLTIDGEELHRLLEERIRSHERRAERWKGEQARTPEEQTEGEPLPPDGMCACEAARHEWRAAVLGFIRDHTDATQSYLLGEADLSFGELLPEKPGCVEQAEYEELDGVGFHVERLTDRLGHLVTMDFARAARQSDGDDG
jgi:hypothetical protein